MTTQMTELSRLAFEDSAHLREKLEEEKAENERLRKALRDIIITVEANPGATDSIVLIAKTELKLL
jgi:hypothetical protein